ncbi:hypothetical protein GCM10027610_093960 [Dactylosporangium cerinum]
MVRAGLRMVIETEPDMQVIGEAGDGVDAVALTRRLRPDVVLMDIAMPRQDGLTATRALLAAPSPPRVIVLTTFDTDDNLYEALRAGASGFLLKVSSPEHLITAIRVVAAGEALLDPAVTTRVIASYAGTPGPQPPRSSPSSPRARPTSCASWPAAGPTARSRPPSPSARPR